MCVCAPGGGGGVRLGRCGLHTSDAKRQLLLVAVEAEGPGGVAWLQPHLIRQLGSNRRSDLKLLQLPSLLQSDQRQLPDGRLWHPGNGLEQVLHRRQPRRFLQKVT